MLTSVPITSENRLYLPYISSLAKIYSMRCLAFPIFFFQIEASHKFLMVGWSLSHLWALAAKEPGKVSSNVYVRGAGGGGKGKVGKPTRWEIPQILEVCSKYAGQPQNINVLHWH